MGRGGGGRGGELSASLLVSLFPLCVLSVFLFCSLRCSRFLYIFKKNNRLFSFLFGLFLFLFSLFVFISLLFSLILSFVSLMSLFLSLFLSLVSPFSLLCYLFSRCFQVFYILFSIFSSFSSFSLFLISSSLFSVFFLA